MTHTKTLRSLVSLVALLGLATISRGQNAANPHNRAPADRPTPAIDATRGLPPLVSHNWAFDAAPFATAATIALTGRDLNGDGRITGDAGFYGVLDGANEVEFLSIEFWNGDTLEQAVCVSNGAFLYPFTIFDWNLAEENPTTFDLGADPGRFLFTGEAITSFAGVWYFDTETLDIGTIETPVSFAPTDAAQITSVFREAYIAGMAFALQENPFGSGCIQTCNGFFPPDSSIDAGAMNADLGVWSAFFSDSVDCRIENNDCGVTGGEVRGVAQQFSNVSPNLIGYEIRNNYFMEGTTENADARTRLEVDFTLTAPTPAAFTSNPLSTGCVTRPAVHELILPDGTPLSLDRNEVRILPPGDYQLRIDARYFGELESACINGGITFLVGSVRNVTQQTAHRSIQEAIANATDGDVVEVPQGTWRELLNLSGKAITLRSTDPTDPAVVDATIINGRLRGDSTITGNAGETRATVIDGLTVFQGDAEQGGNVELIDSSPTFRRCVLRFGFADRGGAVAAINSEALFDRCRFEQSAAVIEGGALYVEGGAPVFANCLFQGSAAITGDGALMSSVDAAPQLLGCTIAGGASVQAVIISRGNNAPTIQGSIIWNNLISGSDAIIWETVAPLVENSIVQGGYAGPGANVLDVNPLFVSSFDLRLGADSPAIDAGDAPALDNLQIDVDLDGAPRFVDDPFTEDTGAPVRGIVADMGAYEYQGDIVTVPGDFATIQAAIDASPGRQIIEIAPGTYRERINTLGKALVLRSTDPADRSIVDQTIISGDIDGDGAGDEGVIILCESGEGPTTIIDGLSIIDGFSAGAAPGLRSIASGPIVRRCRFEGHVGNFGAATRNTAGSTATYIDCRFVNNRTTQSNGGPAAWNGDSSPTFINCLMAGNNSDSGGFGGSGCVITNINSAIAVINCTITNNIGGLNTIFNFGASSLTMANAILWNNQPFQEINGSPADHDVRYSIIEGGWPGSGNLNADPIFVSPMSADYRLAISSPAIDAGDTPAATDRGLFFDIAGLPRRIDDPATPDAGVGPAPVVDIGAHEFDPAAGVEPVASCPGDADGDNLVDFNDLNLILDRWGQTGPAGTAGDITGDGAVNFDDLNQLLDNWGAACP